MTPPSGDDEEQPHLPPALEGAYWKLKGHLQVFFERHIDQKLDRMERRILEGITGATEANKDLERRVRGVEGAMPDRLHERLRDVETESAGARASANLLKWLVPLGFTATALLIALLNLLHH